MHHEVLYQMTMNFSTVPEPRYYTEDTQSPELRFHLLMGLSYILYILQIIDTIKE